MAQISTLVVNVDDSDEDLEVIDVANETETINQVSPNESKSSVGKKRTCRGIAFHKSNVVVENEDESHRIYTTLINNFRETKKKFSPQDVLAEISAENRAAAKESSVVRNDDLQVLEDALKQLDDKEILEDCLNLKDDDVLSLLPTQSFRKTRRRTRSKRILYKNIEAAQRVYRNSFPSGVAPPFVVFDDDDDDNVDVVCIDEAVDKEVKVKIRWRLEITRMVMKRNQKFVTILPKLSQKFSTPENRLLLSFNDTTIFPDDSPESICLKITDIIDCGVVVNDKENYSSLSSNGHNVPPADLNLISLKFQSKNKKNNTVLKANKLKPLSALVEEYARLSNVDPKKIIFKFDGETLDAEETAEDLELEDGFCIDVIECT